MKKLIYCSIAASLFVMTSCQKEELLPTKIHSPNENLIIEGNEKIDDDSITIASPINGITPNITSNSLNFNTGSNNEVDLITFLKDNEQFSTFYAALFKSGMIDQLDTDGPFTFFVPDNEAFGAFLNNNDWETIDDVPINTLNLIVKFHISNVEVKIDELTNSISVPILFNDKTVFINMENPDYPLLVLGLTSAYILKSDLVQSNGVIHHINGVLSL